MGNRNVTIPLATATPGAKSAAEKFLGSDLYSNINIFKRITQNNAVKVMIDIRDLNKTKQSFNNLNINT